MKRVKTPDQNIRKRSKDFEVSQELINHMYIQEFISYTDAGFLAGTTKQAIEDLIRRKRLKRYTINGKRYVKSNDLKDYLLAQKKKLMDKIVNIKLPQ